MRLPPVAGIERLRLNQGKRADVFDLARRIKKRPESPQCVKGENGRAGEIRTHDLLHPMQARYQTTLRPDK